MSKSLLFPVLSSACGKHPAHPGTGRSCFWAVLPSQLWLSPPKPFSSAPSPHKAQEDSLLPLQALPQPGTRSSTAMGVSSLPLP